MLQKGGQHDDHHHPHSQHSHRCACGEGLRLHQGPEEHLLRRRPGSVDSEENIAPDTGEGSVWNWQSHVLFVPFHGTLTRETYVPQERIVDHSTTGVTYAFTVKPADAGTTLIMEVGVSSRVPFLDKVEDKVFWKGDRDLDKYLGIYKKATEA